MQYHDNKLSATYEEISSAIDPIVKRETLHSWLTRGVALYARKGCGRGVKALVEVSSLPVAVQEELKRRYGMPEEPERKDGLEVYYDRDAANYYAEYTYYMGDGTEVHLPEGLKEEYTINASVLNALIVHEKQLRLLANKLCNNRGAAIWGVLLMASESLRPIWNHTLPGSERKLREKLSEYKKGSYAALISKKVGNANSIKITKEAGNYLVALKQSHLPTLSNSDIFKAYNATCGAYGWKPLESENTLVQYLYSPAVKPMWDGVRRGEHKVYQELGYKHSTLMPRKRNSLWYIDGTKLNLHYVDKGERRSVMVVEVIDAKSNVLLGYGISEKEDFLAQYLAVRMALETAGERPYEIVHDNQGGQTSKIATEWLDRVALVHRTTQPSRPQSKTIEGLFYRLQKEQMSRYPWFTGYNVTSKNKEYRPNLEWLDANKTLLPQSIEELEEQYKRCRNRWNADMHEDGTMTRWEMYMEGVNEALTPFTEAEKRELMLVTKERTIKFCDEGLTMTWQNVDYEFDAYTPSGDGGLLLPDAGWRLKHTDESFAVRFDPTDLTKVYLYQKDKNGELRFERTLEKKIVIHRAVQEQTHADRKFIRAVERVDKESRIALEAERRALTELFSVGQKSLAPDPKGFTVEERRLLDRATERIRKQLEAEYAELGIDPEAHKRAGCELLEMEPEDKKGESFAIGESLKAESMMTWSDLEKSTSYEPVKKTAKTSKSAIKAKPVVIKKAAKTKETIHPAVISKDEIRQRVKDKY